MSRVSLLITVACVSLWPGSAEPQARVTDVTPAGIEVSATRLGSTASEAVVAGAADLMPGDLLSCDETDAIVVLECPPGSSSSVHLTAPFRVAVSVPGSSGCHIDLQAGDADVLDEEDTEVTIGGVEMKAVGTQFAARVWRGEEGVEHRVVVYDGEVEVREFGDLVRLRRGTMLAFDSSLAVRELVAAPPTEVERSARVYSRADLTKAEKAGFVGDREALQARLQSQYRDVLTEPENEARRVELAKTQIEYKVSDRAIYNLKRAGVDDQESYERYQIDGSLLDQGVSPVNRLYLERLNVLARATGGDALIRVDPPESELPRIERRSAEIDLELVAAGQAREALKGIEYRLQEGSHDSREFYALARAYESLGLEDRAVAAARRALLYARRDGRLGEPEVEWSRALIERLSGR